MISWEQQLRQYITNVNGDCVSQYLNNDKLQPPSRRLFDAFSGLQPNDVRMIFFGQFPGNTGLAYNDDSQERFGSGKISGETSMLGKLILLQNGIIQNINGAYNRGEDNNVLCQLNDLPTVEDFFKWTQKNGVLWLNVSLTFNKMYKGDDKQLMKDQHLYFWKPLIRKVIQDVLSVRDCLFICPGSKTQAFKKCIMDNAITYKRQVKIIIVEHFLNPQLIKKLIKENIFQQIRYGEIDLGYDDYIDFMRLKKVDV